MKAIILAAGKAARLLPLTKDIPQAMLKVGETPILERQRDNLQKAGVDDIVVVTGYLAHKLEESSKELGVKTLFNPFYEVSGMATSLWIAKEELKDGFIFLYSDVLFDTAIIQGLLKSREDICLAVKKNGLREEAEKVVERDGIIKQINKESGEGVNGEFIGIAKFSANGAERTVKVLQDTIRDNLGASFINAVDNMIKQGERVAAFDIKDSSFADIDFPEDLEKAATLYLS